MSKLATAAALILFMSETTIAATADYQIGFGPFVGSGATSGGAKVRNSSGYTLSVERPWPIGSRGLTLGPRIEVDNTFLNLRQDIRGTSTISTYDNRVVAAGLRLGKPAGAGSLAQGTYLTAVVGRAYSKLTVDESTDRTYNESLYGNIYGSYFGTELGTWIQLKGNFGLDLAFLGSFYRANQQDATGTYQGNHLLADNTVALTEGSYGPSGSALAKTVDLKTYAVKVGLSLGF